MIRDRRADRRLFEGMVPRDKVIPHNWREDVVRIGEVPASYASEVSEGLINNPLPVEINKRIIDPSYDSILSIAQVVPHGCGNANYTKNTLVGCGGKDTINRLLFSSCFRNGAHHGQVIILLSERFLTMPRSIF